MTRSPDIKLGLVAGIGLFASIACGVSGRPEVAATAIPETPLAEPCNQLPRAHPLVENCLKLLNYLATEPINAERTLTELMQRGSFTYRVLLFGTQPHDFYLTDVISPDMPLSSRRLPITIYESTRYPRDEGYFNFARGNVIGLSIALGVYTEIDYGPGRLNQIFWAVTQRADSRFQFNAIAERDTYNRFNPGRRSVEEHVYLRSNTYAPQFPNVVPQPSRA